MTATAPAATWPTSYGSARPRVATPTPPADNLAVVDLCAGVMSLAGHPPMPWQEVDLEATCGRLNDRWTVESATTVVARQNGKTDLVAGRVLAETRFLRGRCLYTTASLEAAVDLWRRVDGWVDSTPALRRAVTDIKRSNGRERLAFRGGGVLQIKTTGGRPPRGFDRVSLLIYDEARELLTAAATAALNPTQTAAADPQRLYFSNAGSRRSVVLNARRDAGRADAAAGVTGRRAWLEWSAPPGAAMDDVAALCAANPAIGHTITLDYLLSQLPPEMPEADFRVEHLCQWDDVAAGLVTGEEWAGLEVAGVTVPRHAAIGFDVDADRSAGAIAAAWRDDAGRLILAVLEHRPSTGWLAGRLVELRGQLPAGPPPCFDTYGPAGDVADEVRRAGLEVTGLPTADVTAAAASIDAAIRGRAVWHTAAPPLDTAIAVATRRPVGDRFVWGRRTSTGSIAPLNAGTFAAWSSDHRPPPAVKPAART